MSVVAMVLDMGYERLPNAGAHTPAEVWAMSGGTIIVQGEGDHQQVTFMFAGKLSQQNVDKWNNAIQELKQTFGASLMAVTVKGMRTPVKFRPKAKPR